MKKIKLLSFASLPLAMALLAGCGHEHTFSDEWTTNAEKHWHDATCEHKDQHKDEGPHVDDDKNNKCDVCGYDMGAPTPTPSGGEVSEDEWVAAFGLSKPFYLADNYKLTMSILMGNNPQNGYVIADGSKLKAGQEGGAETDAVYNEIANGKKYQYDYISSAEKWEKTEVRETAADDIAEFFLPFGQNYKLFTFDAQSKSYKCASITFEGTPISDLEIKFENKQIIELSSKTAYGDGGGVMSVAVSVVYGGQVVELPQAEEHTHSYVDKHDEYSHWNECSCGEQEPGSMGAHSDSNWDLKCDVCGYDMPVEVEPGYYIRCVNVEFYASLEEISGKYVMDSFWFDADLQFAIYQVTSTEYNKFSLLTLSEDDDTKNSGISLSDGVVTINEPGSKTLTFDPAGNEGKGVLSAKKDEGPEPGSPVYGYKLNSAEYVQMIFESKNNQWEAYDIEMKANDTLTIADINGSLLEPIVYSLLQIGGETQGFSIVEGVLTAGKDGVYSFYVDAVNDVVYIADNTPVASGFSYFINTSEPIPMTLLEENHLLAGNVSLNKGDTIKFADTKAEVIYLTTLSITGEAQGFDIADGVLTANVTGKYDFEVYLSMGADTVVITPKVMPKPFSGAIKAGGQDQGTSVFYFNKIDSDNKLVEYKILNAEIPNVPVTITLNITKDDAPVVVNELEPYGAYADFSLSSDGLTLTYVATGANAYNFYLKDSYDKNHVALYVEYVNPPTPVNVTVTLSVTKDVGMGNGLYILGSFNDWDISKAIRGTWTEGNVWIFELQIPASTEVSYKLAIANYDDATQGSTTWEADPDRILNESADASYTLTWQD